MKIISDLCNKTLKDNEELSKCIKSIFLLLAHFETIEEFEDIYKCFVEICTAEYMKSNVESCIQKTSATEQTNVLIKEWKQTEGPNEKTVYSNSKSSYITNIFEIYLNRDLL